MFALMINKANTPKDREFVRSVASFLMFYGTDWPFSHSFSYVQAGLTWTHCHDPVLYTIFDADLKAAMVPNGCLIGIEQKKAAKWTVHATVATLHNAAHEIGISITDTNSILTVRRKKDDEIWLGRYNKKGVEFVVASSDRNAIIAACGSCGCLFDKNLQLWLPETKTTAAYQLGSQEVLVIPDGTESKRHDYRREAIGFSS